MFFYKKNKQTWIKCRLTTAYFGFYKAEWRHNVHVLEMFN